MLRLQRLKMRRLFLLVFYYLGRAGSVQQSSPLLHLNFTQRPYSYVVFCTPQMNQEQITQMHWKQEHANGTYSVITVLNPHWGNYTESPYRDIVTLYKKDGKSYIMEILAQEICICCEVVTFPSGSIHQNCITIEEHSDADNSSSALLGTLLVGGFFVLGSFVLVCRICWMRKSSRRVIHLRDPRQQMWTTSRRMQVPYRRTLPSWNLAYESPHDTSLYNDTPPPTRAHLQFPHPTIQLASGDLPSRNPTMNSHWPYEHLSRKNPSPLSAPPPRSHAVQEALPKTHPIYNNIHHYHKQYPKVRHVKSLQIESTINQHLPEMFSYEGTDPTSSIPHYHTKSCSWLFEGASYPPEDIASSHRSRLNGPRTPELPFTTVNPMYNSGAVAFPFQQCPSKV